MTSGDLQAIERQGQESRRQADIIGLRILAAPFTVPASHRTDQAPELRDSTPKVLEGPPSRSEDSGSNRRRAESCTARRSGERRWSAAPPGWVFPASPR